MTTTAARPRTHRTYPALVDGLTAAHAHTLDRITRCPGCGTWQLSTTPETGPGLDLGACLRVAAARGVRASRELGCQTSLPS